MGFSRTLILTLLIAATVCVAGPSARAMEEAAAEEWIFEVRMPPKWLIAPALLSYQYEGRYYLPVLQLAAAFEFYVNPEIDRGYVAGFAGTEDQNFTIDRERNEITVKGKSQSVAPYAFLPPGQGEPGDIYVQLEVLNELWPITMQVDLSTLSITVAAKGDMAFLERFKRNQRKEKLAIDKVNATARKDLPYIETPYQMMGKPVIDLDSSLSYDTEDSQPQVRQNISGVQQIGKMMASFNTSLMYENGELKIPDNVRLKLEKDITGPDTGPALKPRHYEGGDIIVRQPGLVAGSVSGRGFALSNSPAREDTQLDRITVEGSGPPGWDIELYRNEELIDTGAVAPDGEYRFDNVLLEYGNNAIRIILYGPQGQVREDVRNYNINQSMRRPGEFRYYIGAADSDVPLFDVQDDDVQNNAEGWAGTANMSFGLGPKLTLLGSYTTLPTAQGDKSYYSTGTVYSTPFGIAQLDAYKQDKKGHAFDFRFITKWLGVNLNLRTALLKNFESPEVGFGTQADNKITELQANRNFLTSFGNLGLRLNFAQTQQEDGDRTDTYAVTQSFNRGGYRFSNTTATTLLNGDNTDTNGLLSATIRRGPWQHRLGVGYLLYPETEFTDTQAEIRYRTRKDFQAALNFQHDLQNSASTVGAQIGYDFLKVLSSFDVQYQDNGGVTFLLRASTSLDPYNLDHAYRLTSQTQRDRSPVLARIFLDKDMDGRLNGDDEPLENARLLVDGARSLRKTDAQGYVVADAPSLRKVNVEVDKQALEDPYMMPGNEGYSTVPLPGAMPEMLFPVIQSGAIDGTAYQSSGSPLAGARLQLLDDKGAIIATVDTAPDGIYSFEFLKPGQYRIQGDPDQNLALEPVDVAVTMDELFAFGIDIQAQDISFGPFPETDKEKALPL